MVRCVPTLALVGILAVAGRLATADLPELQSKGTLRVLMIHDPRRPEFVSLDPAQPPSFDRKIVDNFARLHRLKTEWVTVPGWDDLVPDLVESKNDLITG